MRLTDVYRIRSKERIINFLNEQHTGSLGTIDRNGYPQIIPMNFVYHNDSIYMHSYHLGEKIDNIKRNPKVGFEVHEEVAFLPSYFFDPHDASQADTLYVSVVVKGIATIVTDLDEKTEALNALMKKYQKEGGYEYLRSDMNTVRGVAVIKIVPEEINGKYKLGQHWPLELRMYIAKQILERDPEAKRAIEMMGFRISNNKILFEKDPNW